jgi:hypothetical protein
MLLLHSRPLPTSLVEVPKRSPSRLGLQPMTDRPASIPSGLRVELSRARVKPGMGGEVDRWMQMLNDRLDECVATLDRERMAVELIFRDRDEQGEWLYVMSIQGEGGEGLDASPHAIDRDHAEFSRRCKEPGWLEAEPQLLLLPEPVRRAVVQWATGGSSVTD